ncbi:MAG: hypothetical protein OCC45_07155 [Desulfotalea sp.]
MQGIEEISHAIGEINNIVVGISESVEPQTTTTSEIAGNINQADHGIQELTQNVEEASIVSKEVSQDITNVDLSSN